MIQTAFEEWVREAEQRFSLARYYPFINDVQIDMQQELWGLAHRVVDEEPLVRESETRDGAEEPAVEFLELRLIGSRNALPVRFVILNFLYRLAHFTGFLSESSAPLLRSVVWPHLERFVRLQEIDELDDPRSFRGEIYNACVIRDWDRAMDLIDRLKSLGAITESERRALKGQLYICSVVIPRIEAAKEGEWCWRDYPGWWLPQMDLAYGHRAFTLLSWGTDLTDGAEYSVGERERFSDAANKWDVCFGDNSDLLGAYRAAWGKCHFLSGDYLRAAKQFDRLISHGCGMSSEIMEIDDPRPGFYLSAAECFSEGGDTDAAIRRLEECGQKFPKTQGLWLKLAKLHLSRPLDSEVQQNVLACLRKEEQTDPKFGEDPRASLAFTLAELGGTEITSALREFAKSNPEIRQVVDMLVSKHWAGFRSLDKKSKEEWVAAASFLWGTDPRRRPLQPGVVGIFSKVAEGRLRKLFGDFRNKEGPTVLQSVLPEQEKDKLVKFLERSYLTLGEMIHEIDATRRQAEPAHPELKSWLHRNARRLIQSWDSSRAWRLNELRCRSSHGGEISEQEALELYDLSVWLISQLPEN